jgi:hypothetical protein
MLFKYLPSWHLNRSKALFHAENPSTRNAFLEFWLDTEDAGRSTLFSTALEYIEQNYFSFTRSYNNHGYNCNHFSWNTLFFWEISLFDSIFKELDLLFALVDCSVVLIDFFINLLSILNVKNTQNYAIINYNHCKVLRYRMVDG